MPIRRVVIALVLAVLTAAPAELAAQSAKTRYERALARDKSLRETRRTPPLSQLRSTVRSYEQIARRYPTSGYADNALYKGGLLALETYRHYQAEEDRDAGLKMLEWMIREYPTSSLETEARAHLRAIDGSRNARRSDDDETDGEEVAASAPTALATVQRIKRTDLPDGVRVTVELDREFTFRKDTLGNPPRVFVDLQGVTARGALREILRSDDDEDILRAVRVGPRGDDVTRVALELAHEAEHRVSALSSPFRLVIDVQRPVAVASSDSASGSSSPEPLNAPFPRPAEANTQEKEDTEARVAETTRNVPQPFPAVGPRADEIARAEAETETPAVETPTPAPPRSVAASSPRPLRIDTPDTAGGGSEAAPEAAVSSTPTETPTLPTTRTAPSFAALEPPKVPEINGSGRFSMSRQLGLGIARVVIDPGHGGHDPGTRSNGVVESELVLDVALRLEQLLKQRGVDVVLTRRTDEFIELEERAPIASRHKADLFLSIHANASRNRGARGIETYYLNFASDKLAEAVAARENATSVHTMQELPNIVQAIALNNKLDESRDFAGMVQTAMVNSLGDIDSAIEDRGVKRAPFVVLIGAKMPAILAEIAFVSNREEAALLKTSAYRQRIAEALRDGVLRYQRSLKATGTVAEQ